MKTFLKEKLLPLWEYLPHVKDHDETNLIFKESDNVVS